MNHIQCGDLCDDLQGFRDTFMNSMIYHNSPDNVFGFFLI